MKLIHLNNLRVPVLIVEMGEKEQMEGIPKNVFRNDGASSLATRDKHGFGSFYALPPGKWELLCKMDQMTEEQAAEIVHYFVFNNRGYAYTLKYRNYVEENKYNAPYETALESFQSAIRAAENAEAWCELGNDDTEYGVDKHYDKIAQLFYEQLKQK